MLPANGSALSSWRQTWIYFSFLFGKRYWKLRATQTTSIDLRRNSLSVLIVSWDRTREREWERNKTIFSRERSEEEKTKEISRRQNKKTESNGRNVTSIFFGHRVWLIAHRQLSLIFEFFHSTFGFWKSLEAITWNKNLSLLHWFL